MLIDKACCHSSQKRPNICTLVWWQQQELSCCVLENMSPLCVAFHSSRKAAEKGDRLSLDRWCFDSLVSDKKGNVLFLTPLRFHLQVLTWKSSCYWLSGTFYWSSVEVNLNPLGIYFTVWLLFLINSLSFTLPLSRSVYVNARYLTEDFQL